jgi:hypothetical protein
MNWRQVAKRFGFSLQRILNSVDVIIGGFAGNEVKEMWK